MSQQARRDGSWVTNADRNRWQAQASRELTAILAECPDLPPIAWALSPGGNTVTGTVSGLPSTEPLRAVFGAWRDALGLEEIPAEPAEPGRVTWLRARTVRSGVRVTLTAWVYEDDTPDSDPGQVPEPRPDASRRQADRVRTAPGGLTPGLLPPPNPPGEPGPVQGRLGCRRDQRGRMDTWDRTRHTMTCVDIEASGNQGVSVRTRTNRKLAPPLTAPTRGSSALMTDRDLQQILLAPAGPWMAKAACAHVEDPDIFHPEHGTGQRARQVCAACPVRAECLEHALAAGEEYGIWGGLDPRERRNLKRRRARQRATEAGRDVGGTA